jgi:hypothetical protein
MGESEKQKRYRARKCSDVAYAMIGAYGDAFYGHLMVGVTGRP